MPRVLTVCGSLRGGSGNAALLRTAAVVAPAGVEVVACEAMASLPHFNPDDDFAPLPPAVAELRAALAATDAILFSTPEYAGALPGAFKNLLDWTVGGPEMDGRPVAWANTAGPASPSGGAGAHAELRTVLGYVNARIVEDACVRIPVARGAIGEDGLVAGEAPRAALAAALATLAAAAS